MFLEKMTTKQQSTHLMSGRMPKKKHFRYFESYIPKFMKQNFSENGLTLNAKKQLNSALCFVSENIANKAKTLTRTVNKKTISHEDVLAASELTLSDDLFVKVMQRNTEAITQFTSNSDTKKGESRQAKAGLVLPPSIAEKFLRDFNSSNMLLTSSAPITLCVVLETVLTDLLDKAVTLAKDSKKVRVTVRELELASKDLESVFAGFQFLGGGVVPYIHPTLLVKKARKRTKKASGEPRKHKFKPGTVALRDMKKLQKVFNHLMLSKSPFEKLIRQVLSDLGSDAKVSKDVLTLIQYYVEGQVSETLRKANLAALHAGRVKMVSDDIKFIVNLEGNQLMETTEEESEEVVEETN